MALQFSCPSPPSSSPDETEILRRGRGGGRQQRRCADRLLHGGPDGPVVYAVQMYPIYVKVHRAQPREIPWQSVGGPYIDRGNLLPTHSWATCTAGEVLRGRAAPAKW